MTLANIRKLKRTISLSLIAVLILQTGSSNLFALTGGPSQPEFQQFQPAGMSDLVDPFTGDFKYNIPLFDVGGYPINLSYNSNISQEDEAGWVGLGWSLNPGNINRNLRGIPDDFKGDIVEEEMNIRDNTTVGAKASIRGEIFGTFGIGLGSGLFYNTYNGWGLELSVSPSLNIAGKNDNNASIGLNLDYNSQAGLSLGASLGSKMDKESWSLNSSLSINGYNTRTGLKTLNFNTSANSGIVKYNSFAGSFDFNSPTYFPQSEFPMKNTGFMGDIGGGAAFWGIYGKFACDGYINKQALATKHLNTPSYGLIYAKNHNKSSRILSDYNKEKNIPYRNDMDCIAQAYATPDQFYFNSQTGGGQFQVVRNDLGIFSPPYCTSTGSNGSLGVEFGGPSELGINGGLGIETSYADTWHSGNSLEKKLKFTEKKLTNQTTEDALYEPSHILVSGELAKSDPNLKNQIGNYKPIRVKFKNGSANNAIALDAFQSQDGQGALTDISVTNQIKNTGGRQARNTMVSTLTAKEASVVSLMPEIENYRENTFNACDDTDVLETIDRTNRPGYHMSEIQMTMEDGSRQIFGLPIYNNFQEEISFALAPIIDPEDPATDEISYTSTENSLNNGSGTDHYYKKQKTPAYATGYLLTSIMSPDYYDVKNDGITEDDLGNAIKFNYFKSGTTNWRAPFNESKAKWNKGNLSDPDDDKGSLVYGQRENWFLHSIESKKEVAHFYTSERLDDRNFLNVNGIPDTENKPLRKLDYIKIYSVSELKEKGITYAVPIKVIHFVYDYILCPLENGTQPKLTLTDVYITYEKSGVRYGNYHFDYYQEYSENGNTKTFKHGPLKQDRWGSYRSNDYTYNEFLDWFPYTLQNKTVQDEYAKAFKISKITLPSGGYIDINYESDDYAYVQDKRAGQMLIIEGFSKDEGTTSNLLYTDKDNVNNEIVVALPEACPESEVLKRYFEDVNQIFADFEVDLKGDGLHKERIRGYLNYDPSAITFISNGDDLIEKVRIPINLSLGENSMDYHPMTVIGSQILRTSLQKYMYTGYSNENPGEATIQGLKGFIDEITALFKSWDRKIIEKKYVQKVTVDHSWIRLANGNLKKLGGGSRVHTLVMHDNWDNMDSGQNASEYTQKYTYTTKIKIGEEEREISSGVASWEPFIGREENLHIRQVAFKEKVILAPDNFFYTEKPYCEGLFPGPSVGYSEVKMQNIIPSVDNSSNGYNIKKFYTARDFPTLVTNTSKYPFSYKSPSLGAMFFKKVQRTAASQGFVIETNDMHGKPKEETSFNEAGNEIESSRYDYFTQNTGDRIKLNNEVSLIHEDGSKSIGEVGVVMQTSQEFYESDIDNKSISFQGNINIVQFGLFPIPIPSGYPGINLYQSSLKTATNTKHIHRTGILKSVTKRLNGSSSTTENIAFDAGTGRPVVTSVQNEFSDLLFNTNYPAYWAYQGMGGAYNNEGAEGFVNLGTNRQINFDDPVRDILTPGDELLIGYEDDGELKILDETYSVLELLEGPIIVDRRSEYIPYDIPETVYFKILRSGKRNLLNANVYSYNSRTTPLGSSTTGLQNNTATEILNTSASELSEKWPVNRIEDKVVCEGVNCSYCNLLETDDVYYNPYAHGMRGNWRPWKTWAYQQARGSVETAALGTDLRIDGTISSYDHFWKFISVSGSPYRLTKDPNNHWVRSESISKYDAAGNAIESYDALDVPSAALYARDNQFVVAAAKNARHQDIAVDGFEDWPKVLKEFPICTFNGCFLDPHFDFMDLSSTDRRSTAKAHTGKYSFHIPYYVAYYSENRLVETTATSGSFYTITELTPGLGKRYVFTENGLIPGFKPKPGKYIVSGWVYESEIGNSSSIDIKVYSDDNCSTLTNTYSLTAKGQIIDGWRRIFNSIEIPSGSHCINITLTRDGNECFFDDVRIHPYDAQMKSFIYDYSLNRLMATLDENNYASFYEYDDAGQLVRIKRETDKGIRTIKEERAYMPRQQQQ